MNQTVRSESPCILTGSHEAEVIAQRDRSGPELRTVICKQSGLVYTDPRPSAQWIRDFYAERYRAEYKGVRRPRKKHVLRASRRSLALLASIHQLVRPGMSVLDVGSGGGELLELFRVLGCRPTGIEPNRGYGEYARSEYGHDVFIGFIQDARFAPKSFDIITMTHVLEHLDDPVRILGRLASWLKDDGCLVIEVPNVEDLTSSPGQKWHIAHLFHFNATTLAAAAQLVQLSIHTMREGRDLFAIFQRSTAANPVSLAGNYQRVARALRSYRARRLVTAHGCRRMFQRAGRSVVERIQTARFRGPRQIAHNVYGQMAATGPGHAPFVRP